ncbi:hypothetical protein FQN50_009681 [Emmonsiellopsis sp. PD_5]|nr:hypothetical protein FQN50_009681 [Emmonsiellopsis sp. PD_5]
MAYYLQPQPANNLGLEQVPINGDNEGASLASQSNNNLGPLYKQKSFRQRWFGGLKSSLFGFAIGTAVAVFANVGWIIAATKHYGNVEGIGTIQRGDCAESKKLNVWLHLLINVLSTVVLSGSIAFVQAFSAPTRKEIDRAHFNGRWLHTGVLSLRNFLHISRRKTFVCVILVITSLPFHLLYNSLVFTSVAVNKHGWAVVTEDFLHGAPFNATFSRFIPEVAQREEIRFTEIQKEAKSYQRIDSGECIKAYASRFQGKWRNVALISNKRNATTSILTCDATAPYGEGTWLCSGDKTCNTDSLLKARDSWEVYGHPVQYCMAERVPEVCSVHFSLKIMSALIVFNSVKLLAMFYILYRFDVEDLITSVGDAAASFLANEDTTTRWMCLASKRTLASFWFQERYRSPTTFSNDKREWSRAISRTRWLTFLAFMMICLTLVFMGLVIGLIFLYERDPSMSPSRLWKMGLGGLDSNALVFVGSDHSLIQTVITANIPQVFLAIINVAYNSILVPMYISYDWNQFAFLPRTLMVSSPAGRQRGTWLLGIPFACGLPLLGAHTALHWLVSQSIFIVQADIYDSDGKQLPERESNCGYSPIAIIFSLAVGVVLLIVIVSLGRRNFREGGPPIASTCSAAISAACHLGYSTEKVVYEELKWGEIGPGTWAVGHCSLAPAELWNGTGNIRARDPILGRFYA